jgi:hypothetical protein
MARDRWGALATWAPALVFGAPILAVVAAILVLMALKAPASGDAAYAAALCAGNPARAAQPQAPEGAARPGDRQECVQAVERVQSAGPTIRPAELRARNVWGVVPALTWIAMLGFGSFAVLQVKAIRPQHLRRYLWTCAAWAAIIGPVALIARSEGGIDDPAAEFLVSFLASSAMLTVQSDIWTITLVLAFSPT